MWSGFCGACGVGILDTVTGMIRGCGEGGANGGFIVFIV